MTGGCFDAVVLFFLLQLMYEMTKAFSKSIWWNATFVWRGIRGIVIQFMSNIIDGYVIQLAKV